MHFWVSFLFSGLMYYYKSFQPFFLSPYHYSGINHITLSNSNSIKAMILNGQFEGSRPESKPFLLGAWWGCILVCVGTCIVWKRVLIMLMFLLMGRSYESISGLSSFIISPYMKETWSHQPQTLHTHTHTYLVLLQCPYNSPALYPKVDK